MKNRRTVSRASVMMCAAAGIVAVAGVADPAAATVVYWENFENRVSYPEWSLARRQEAPPVFSAFLGRFLNERTTLTLNLPALPAVPRDIVVDQPTEQWVYRLEFRFYAIDSWDGHEQEHGSDRFTVKVNNTALFSETFANTHTGQSYQRSPDVGRAHLGFDPRWMDSIYNMSMDFLAPAGSSQISFEASGLSGGYNDESWGIDNVRVSMVLVPAPGTAALLGAGALWAGRRRRHG